MDIIECLSMIILPLKLLQNGVFKNLLKTKCFDYYHSGFLKCKNEKSKENSEFLTNYYLKKKVFWYNFKPYLYSQLCSLHFYTGLLYLIHKKVYLNHILKFISFKDVN